MSYDPNMRPDKRTMIKGISFMIIGNFLFAWVLAFYLADGSIFLEQKK